MTDEQITRDLRAELAILSALNDDIDQLSSQARDCATLSPDLMRILDLAWYICEADLREAGEPSCGHHLTVADIRRRDVGRQHCACCEHYAELAQRGESIRRRL